MAVSLGAQATLFTSSSPSTQYESNSITPGASSGNLIVAIVACEEQTSNDVIGSVTATYGTASRTFGTGTPMTVEEIGSAGAGFVTSIIALTLKNQTAAGTVQIETDVSLDCAVISVTEWLDVDQTTPVLQATSAGETSTSGGTYGLTMTAAGNALVVGFVQKGNSSASSITDGTQFDEGASGSAQFADARGTYGYKIASGSGALDVTASWDTSNDNRQIALELQAAATGASGTLAATESADTLAASGAVLVSGAVAATEAADTLAATGTTLSAISGTMAATEAADTFAAIGAVPVSGTLAATEAGDTLAAIGSIPLNGTFAATETADTFSANGTIPVSGTFAATEGVDTFASSGSVGEGVVGTLAATEPADSLAASGVVLVAGTMAATEATDNLAASGAVAISGTLAATEGADAAAFVGTVQTVGAFAATEGADTLAATGAVSAAATITGTLAATESADTLAAAGGVLVSGTFAATETADAFAASGTTIITTPDFEISGAWLNNASVAGSWVNTASAGGDWSNSKEVTGVFR